MTRWLAFGTLIAVFDQWSKFQIRDLLFRGESIEVAPFFNLVLTYNSGAAFSFLADEAGWQRGFFIVLAIAASAWIIYLLRKHSRQLLFCTALSLILGGAIGNVIDRIWLGQVVDFLDFHAGGAHWPAFNLADSAITCGAALLLWDGVRPHRRH